MVSNCFRSCSRRWCCRRPMPCRSRRWCRPPCDRRPNSSRRTRSSACSPDSRASSRSFLPASCSRWSGRALQRVSSVAMTVLRANVGFTFFHLAFWLRTFDNGTALFGAAIASSALSSMLGNAIAPRVRRMMREETMLTLALALSAAGGIGLAAFGTPAAGIMLAGIVGFSAAIGRLAFESIVQRDAPEANQGRAFASFETRFQFAWAAAAFLAVAIQAPGAIGLLIVGVVAAGTMVQLQFRDAITTKRRRRRRRRRRPSSARRSGRPRAGGPKSAQPSHPPSPQGPPGDDDPTPRRLPRVRATDPEPRSRSESEWPRDR